MNAHFLERRSNVVQFESAKFELDVRNGDSIKFYCTISHKLSPGLFNKDC